MADINSVAGTVDVAKNSVVAAIEEGGTSQKGASMQGADAAPSAEPAATSATVPVVDSQPTPGAVAAPRTTDVSESQLPERADADAIGRGSDGFSHTTTSGDASVADAVMPIYLRALECLHSPFNCCPDAWRPALGTAGMATLFNAVALLLYVKFLRRH